MLPQLIILAVLILVNAYFSASEIAFISLNDAKIEKQSKEGNKKAKQIEAMLRTPSAFLATIQIGITLAGFLSSAFASDAFAEKLAPVLYNWIPTLTLSSWKNISIIIITLILSLFTLIFGELVPKRLAMKYYEKIAFATVGVIKTIATISSPLVKLLTVVTNAISKIFKVGENDEGEVTEEEIKMMVDQGEEKGTIEEEEKELINNVFEFNDITVSEVMKHRKDIFAVDINISNEELMKDLTEEKYCYSRIPVYDETIDEIKGILYLKDIFKNINNKNVKVKDLVKDAYFVSQNRLINEVFGDIYDEYDKVEKEFEKLDENTYLLSGSMNINDVNKLLDAKIPEGEYDTISGYLQDELGRIPKDGESPVIETKTVTYKIEKTEDKRILKIKACKNNVEETQEEK